jgi:hypothetical protein
MPTLKPPATRNGKPLSLYIDPEIRDAGKALAKERYGESLSDLVERLLKAELKRKRGVRMPREN